MDRDGWLRHHDANMTQRERHGHAAAHRHRIRWHDWDGHVLECKEVVPSRELVSAIRDPGIRIHLPRKERFPPVNEVSHRDVLVGQTATAV